MGLKDILYSIAYTLASIIVFALIVAVAKAAFGISPILGIIYIACLISLFYFVFFSKKKF